MSPANMSPMVVAYVSQAVVETFAGCGLELIPLPEVDDESLASGDELAAVIGLTADDESGTFLVSAGRSSLELALAEDPRRQLNDWFGEAANLCVGHLKQALLRHKVSVRIRPPSVGDLEPETLERYSDRNATLKLRFGFKSEGVLVCLFAHDSASFVALPDMDVGETLPKPGDVIIV